MVQVFISYARQDGTENSLKLDEALKAQGIATWRDDRIDPTLDFTGEIEEGLDTSTHVVVVVTPDVKRKDSFVRLEIGYALTQKKAVLPLLFPGGHRPVVIINHTYIDFSNWEQGFSELLARLKTVESVGVATPPPTTRQRELAYLEKIGQRYDHWRDLYTDMSATVRMEERKKNLTPAAQRLLEIKMRHEIHAKIDHTLDTEKGQVIRTENVEELREGIRTYRRVALIGDPGAGKTTTLERLAYEYASAAAEADDLPLPLFVRLGAFSGGDFTAFLQEQFEGLSLPAFLPNRVVLLLDGLNEMPVQHQGLVENWLKAQREVSVVVSCRKLDYVERKLPLQRIDVAPLDLERIRLFMTNYLEDEADREELFWALAGFDARRAWAWYQDQTSEVTYHAFFNEDDDPGYSWIPERKILDRIRQSWREQQQLPDMLGVVTNPFLMSIVLEIYTLTGEPPRNRGELFGRFVGLLFEERGKTAVREDRPWIATQQQEKALATLAYRMQEERTGTGVGIDFVRETFMGLGRDATPEQLLYFAISAGILEGTQTIRFTHQLLQEYFAAYGMGEDIRNGVSASKYFPSEEWWQPTGWEETALLLAGMDGEATRVVEWLTAIQPDLAYKVGRESGVTCQERAWKALYEPSEGARRSPYAVAEWGQMNHERDRREGVGLRPDGLPDLKWCEIPAGKFQYGEKNESREIRYGFKMAKYPITYRQFQAFVDSGEFADARWWEGFPSEYQPQRMVKQNNPYWNHPRDGVSWYQAVAFSRWLDERYRRAGLIPEGMEIRLPVEQEWEYAARGTDGRIYPWGSVYRPGYANIDEESVGPYFLNCTTAVGNYPHGQSPFGVLDMSGNVWEWCLNEYKNPDEYINYGNEEWRALRGGSWDNVGNLARAVSRNYYDPNNRLNDIGFRLVCVPLLNR